MLLSPRPRPPSSFFPSVSFFRSIVLRRIEKAAGEQRGGIRVLRSFSSLVPCSMYRSLLFLLNNAAFVGTNTMTKAAVEKRGREGGRKGRPPLGVLQAPSLFFLSSSSSSSSSSFFQKSRQRRKAFQSGERAEPPPSSSSSSPTP